MTSLMKSTKYKNQKSLLMIKERLISLRLSKNLINPRIRYEFANNRLSTKIAELQADVEQFRQQLLELNNNVAVYKDLADIKTSELKDW